MRTGFIFLGCLWLCATAFAQRRDSVMLADVAVYGLPDEKYLAGSSVQSLDSSLQANERSRHLGEVLSLQLPVYFRNYGSGMLSGISMRGTSPQHTAVLWNGINITSFSLGQADFSILPAAAFDEIKIHEGAGSAKYGSGAFGGTVLLNSKSPAENSLRLSQEAGSFGRYFSSLAAAFTHNKWRFKTKLYDLNSTNDFKILSTGERQQHAQFRQSGILQDIEYKFSASRAISLHYWFHDADRNLQYPVGQVNGNDTQQDQNHRLSLRYQSHSRFGLLSLTGGYVHDAIFYDGSPGTVSRWISGVRHELTMLRTIHLQAGAEWNHITGRIANYNNGLAKEDRYDFTLAAQKDFGERLALAVNFRQPVVAGFSAPFLPYAGADYFLIRKQNSQLKLRMSVSKNYRIPTLNDRYWVDAGNKNLLPETTHAGETGVTWQHEGIEVSGTAFAQKVDEWIQWVPSDNGVYKPHNIKQVLAEGLEATITARKQIGTWVAVPRIVYQYTRSVVKRAPADQNYSVNKQLIYTPKNTGSFYLQIIHRSWSGNLSIQYNGMRFTEAGNSRAYALPAFAIANAGAGRYWILHQHRIDLQGSVRNIFNLNYQLYAGYAQPGRNYNIQITYQLTSNHTLK